MSEVANIKSNQVKSMIFPKDARSDRDFQINRLLPMLGANCPKMLPFFRRSKNVQMQRGLRDERHHTSCRHGNQGKSVDIS